MNNSLFNCIVILGATASGKTQLACKIAAALNGEIISADSRQVYRHLNIGTGKDLEEYTVNEQKIPYHVIDISEPGQQFYLHDFISECEKAFNLITSRNRIPIICGGTGLYLDSLHKNFDYTKVPEDHLFREEAEKKTKEELLEILMNFPEQLRKHADLNSKKRIIRAIEVAKSFSENASTEERESVYKPFYIGIDTSAEERKNLISSRLEQRINNGLIKEAEALLRDGIGHDRLQFLGLEYKFLSLYLKGELSLPEMKEKLTTAIVQFSKRQMTWFRKMEKEGIKINWIKRNEDLSELMITLKKVFTPVL